MPNYDVIGHIGYGILVMKIIVYSFLKLFCANHISKLINLVNYSYIHSYDIVYMLYSCKNTF